MIQSKKILFHLKKDLVNWNTNYYFGINESKYSFSSKQYELKFWKDIFEEKSIIKVVTNSKETYKILKSNGITLEGIWDVNIADFLITGEHFDIKEILSRHNCSMFELHEKQNLELEKNSLEKVAKLEMAAVPAFGDIEFYGMSLDANKWLSLFNINSNELVQTKNFLDNYIISSHLYSCENLNWNSTREVSAVLKEIFPEIKDSSEEELERISLKYPNNQFIKILLKYRKLAKSIGTYGLSYVNHIDVITNKFHPNLNQIGAVSGRPSSNRPNILNIPKKKEFRSCWKADNNCKLIICDYSYCELAIAAYLSEDQNLIKAFNEGLDPHLLTASMLTNIEYSKALKLYEQKDEQIIEFRNISKIFNFALIYGMSEKSMILKYNMQESLVNEFYQTYKKKYSRLIEWLESKGNSGLLDRKIKTKLGRIRKFNPDSSLNFSEKSDIKRASANTVVQGTSADITKLAMVLIRNKVIKKKLYPNIRLYLQIYDEIIVHADEDLAIEAKIITESCMERASNIILGENFRIKAKAIISDNWGESD